ARAVIPCPGRELGLPRAAGAHFCAPAGAAGPPTRAGGHYGLPRASGPGLTHPVGRTAIRGAAVKRPCSTTLTSRNPRPAIGHAPTRQVKLNVRAGWVNPGA